MEPKGHFLQLPKRIFKLKIKNFKSKLTNF